MRLIGLFIVLALPAMVVDCRPDVVAQEEAPPPVTREPPPPAASVVTLPKPVDPRCPTGWTCDWTALDRAPKPTITEILVQKQAHRLSLVSDGTIVKSYRVALGSGGMGQKRVEGDRVTPIGVYAITGRYPSRWHTYLSLSYPAEEDRRRFEELVSRGEVEARLGPGSAIAIHGHRGDQRDKAHKDRDWTLGCVALDNDEIDEVAGLAGVGTKVVIEP